MDYQRSYSMRGPFITLLAITLSAQLFGQTSDQPAKLRLGQSYEQAGDFENALQIYRQLYSSDTTNAIHFENLRRVLMVLKRYDEAELLINERLIRFPVDVNLRNMLANVCYKAGNEPQAFAEWDKALGIELSNPNAYRIVAATMMENRLLDKTAETYRLARVRCNDPNLYTLDLAQILVTSLNYKEATREYVHWLKANPNQLGNVQSRMIVISGKEEGRSAAIEVLNEEIRSDDRIPFQRLLAWLYLEGRQYEEAFTVYRRIDRMSNANGAEIHGFADRAFKDGSFAVAAQAFKEAINKPVHIQLMPFSKYGYASALKGLHTLPDSSAGPARFVNASETQTQYAPVISAFREIITSYPRTEFAARSYYQIAVLQYEKLHDLDGALASFASAESEFSGAGGMRYDIELRMAEVLTAKGDTIQSVAKYRGVASASVATPDQQDEATYRLAELAFFNGRFQEALASLNTITVNLAADYANDALQFLSFLQENTATAEPALREFGRAAFLARQRKTGEAIQHFRSILTQYRNAPLADDALLTIASLQTQTHQFTDAVASYEQLLTDFKENCNTCDKAQFGIAEVFQFGTGQKDKAIVAYEKLLADYPHSLFATTARKRVRELRGDTL